MATDQHNPEFTDSNSYSSGVNAVLKMLHYLFVVLAFGIVIILIWYFSFGGAFTVAQQEQALVMKFGTLSQKVYKPGWHWSWPYPICEVVRIPSDRQTMETNAFWFYQDPSKPPNPEEGPQGGPLTPGKGGYLFTGDTNIIHSSWEMNYVINDPLKYYTKCMGPEDPRATDPILNKSDNENEKIGTRGPQTLIKAIFENAIIEATAKETVDFALMEPNYIKTVESQVKKTIAKADIGIEVQTVMLGKRTPPIAAAQSFRAVFDANNFKFTELEKARAYATKTKNEAESESVKIIANAESYRTRVVASIKADTKYFTAMLKEYRKNPNIVLVSRYSDVLGDVLNKTEDKFVIRANENGKQEIRLLLNREPKKQAKRAQEELEEGNIE